VKPLKLQLSFDGYWLKVVGTYSFSLKVSVVVASSNQHARSPVALLFPHGRSDVLGVETDPAFTA
jgi:hypothetical protein